MGSSPHTRGAREHERHIVLRGGIIPAYAGSTPRPFLISGRGLDHPRIRGEHLDVQDQLSPMAGSSPHTRGALRLDRPLIHRSRIIPAYAGSTTLSLIQKQSAEDHPRIRGEHGNANLRQSTAAGSSPHTRGAPRQRRLHHQPVRIIPAYAGSTAWLASAAIPALGSSPHTRGARTDEPRHCRRQRIIPAYAGSTCTRSTAIVR